MVALLVIAVALGYGTSAPLKDYCKFCINFAQEFLDQLINIIASKSIKPPRPPPEFLLTIVATSPHVDGGVIGGCSDLCEKLANKTHNNEAGLACNILCDLVGIRTFIAILNK